jgi:hypothetical protein
MQGCVLHRTQHVYNDQSLLCSGPCTAPIECPDLVCFGVAYAWFVALGFGVHARALFKLGNRDFSANSTFHKLNARTQL